MSINHYATNFYKKISSEIDTNNVTGDKLLNITQCNHINLFIIKKIYDDINVTANYINSIEIVRRQLLDLKFMLSNTNQKEELISLVDSLESDFLNLEKKLIQLKETGTGQDDVRFEKMIGGKLAYLGGNVPNADFRPSDSYYEVYELLSQRLKDVGVQFETLKNERLKDVINTLNEKGVNMIIIE